MKFEVFSMTLRTMALLIAAYQSTLAMASNREQQVYGQYVCRVEHAVGFQYRAKEGLYAGPIQMPEADVTFGLTIRAIARTESDLTLCKRSFEHFLPLIEHGIQYQPFDAPKGPKDLTLERHSMGVQCLAKDQAILTSVGNKYQWTYRSYDYASQFFGFQPDDWFTFYSNGTFRRSFPYDSGPVLMDGHCVKMPSA